METNNVTQWGIIGAAVVILVAGGVWLMTKDTTREPAMNFEESKATSSESTAATVETKTNTPKGSVTAESDGESVVVEDQAAGSSVAIASMELTRATWIAIRDDMSIMGAAWFPSSATAGTVKLQRAMAAGKNYRAVMYVDDGDKKFDYKKDMLVTAGASPVGVSFSAQ